MSAAEDLDSWEKMMACCFPCGYVWLKEGTGGTCCCNILLGVFFGMCCANVCHACGYVGEKAAAGSPYSAIQSTAVTAQPQYGGGNKVSPVQ